MFEEKKTKNSRSIAFRPFGFPPIVNAYMFLTVLFLFGLAAISIIADQTRGELAIALAGKMMDFVEVVLGATFGALSVASLYPKKNVSK